MPSAGWLLPLLLVVVVASSSAADHGGILQHYSNQSIFTNLTSPYLSYLDDLYYYLEELAFNSSSPKCREDTGQLVRLAREGDSNALRILDSNGKPTSGIMEGGVYFMGFYSECVNTAFQSYQDRVNGKYCLINLQFKNDSQVVPHALWVVLTQSPRPPTIAVCVPSSCTESDVEQASSASIHNNFVGVNTSVSACHGDVTGFKDDAYAISSSVILVFFVLLVLLGSLVEIKVGKEEEQRLIASKSTLDHPSSEDEYARSLVTRFLLCFALVRNLKKIFSLKTGDNIDCIHGLRALTMTIIIFGHTFTFGIMGLVFRNPGYLDSDPKNILVQIFANGTLVVDTFFAISGMLQSYIFCKSKDKQNALSLLQAIPHRLWRLTPSMGATILFCAGLLRYMGSGPNWLNSIMMYDSWCRKNGWINMLYLQNFVNTENMCLSHSWYLAEDFQMFLVSLLILLVYIYSGPISAVLWGVMLGTNIVSTAVITAVNHYPAIPYLNNVLPMEVVNAYYKNVYIKPYTRIGPYLMGMLIGFFMEKKLDIKKWQSAACWSVCIFFAMINVYVMWPAHSGILPGNTESSLYSAFSRPIWGMMIGWLIFACHNGSAGLFNSILSWPFFLPVSRLTFNAYLIHPVVMNAYYGTFQNTVDFSTSFMIYALLGNYILSMLAAVLMTLLFESPFVALAKDFFPHLRKALFPPTPKRS